MDGADHYSDSNGFVLHRYVNDQKVFTIAKYREQTFLFEVIIFISSN